MQAPYCQIKTRNNQNKQFQSIRFEDSSHAYQRPEYEFNSAVSTQTTWFARTWTSLQALPQTKLHIMEHLCGCNKYLFAIPRACHRKVQSMDKRRAGRSLRLGHYSHTTYICFSTKPIATLNATHTIVNCCY